MNASDQNPKIPLSVFFATDFALLAAAAFIAANSDRPLSTNALLGIVVCVITGAGVALVPLVLRFERQKNEMLDERQRALEAVAATVSSSAEQLSIATSGLQQIAELAQKNLRHAEQLPHRLQEKIAEFQSQLANAVDAENEELAKELAALRSTETERLESISDRVARATAEFAKVEAATRQHLSAAQEALGKLALGTAGAIGKAQTAAEQALAHARIDAARHVGESAGQAVRSLETAKAAALAELETKAAAANVVAERVVHAACARITEAIAGLETTVARMPAAAAQAPSSPGATAPPLTAPPELPESAAPPQPAAAPDAAPLDEAVSAATKRPRKPRREEAVPETAVPPPAEILHSPAAVDEPAPVPADAIAEVTPIAPHTADPFAGTTTTVLVHGIAATTHGDGNGAPAPPTPRPERPGKPEPTATASPSAASVPRKRAPRPLADESESAIALDEGSVASSIIERVLTSDGATRLIATAYIGIGNRLFIRGDGPGLSWDKGVPLQFVSIGRWRWETNDATSPVRFKLLKNDEQECSALGAQTLDPGHQQEVTAAF
jgi:hypothetical protein